MIRLSAYATVAHLVLNVIVLALLLNAVTSTGNCVSGEPRCPQLVAARPTWIALSSLILIAQPCLSLMVFSYYFHLRDHSRRPYMQGASSRSLSTSTSYIPDQKHLLSNSETWPGVELGVVEPTTISRSFKIPELEAGYGGGTRTYEQAEQNEKARLRRELEMETEESQNVSFPIPSTSETSILTPLGLQWRDGDLPPYTS